VFQKLKEVNPKDAMYFRDGGADKAVGIFLWVAIVVQSLLTGLVEGGRLSDLQKRLDSLPPDLEDLLWKILNNLGKRHFERAYQFFRIYRATSIGGSIWSEILKMTPKYNPHFRLAKAYIFHMTILGARSTSQ